MSMILRAATVAAALSLGACAFAFDGADRAARSGGDETLIEVQNNNWSDITLYAVQFGTRVRLGTITSMGREIFVVPASLVASSSGLLLLADPIGGAATFVTEPIPVVPGQRIELKLENNLRLSSFFVW